MHLLRAFIHVQVEKIPSKYILKRYCRNARKDLHFDRADRKMRGEHGETIASRHRKVMTKAMQLVRAAIMSNPAMERSLEGLDELIRIVSELEPDVGVCDIDEDEADVSSPQACILID